jgi:hypothetical protein
MVNCELCRRAELTRWSRLIEVFTGPPGGPLAGFGDMLRFMVSGPTLYERHREEYVRTGDAQELTRMERHVT